MTELVLCETRNAVAILTLNRPEKLNALIMLGRSHQGTREALDAWIARRPPRYQAR
jgi:enoyl-CoA hydratase/carnithine racemase